MSQSYRPPAPPASRTSVGLLITWAALTAAGLGFVLHFGRNAPWADEWEMLPGLVGDAPLGPWLTAQHNEHRLPLPRLLWWGLFQLTHDFRAGMVAQVLLLSAAALGLMTLLKRRRGRAAWADAFVPLGLLHWGHVENLVMGYQLCFVLTACGLMAAASVAMSGRNRGTAAAVAGVALLTELTGGSGLVAAAPLVLWAGWRMASTLPDLPGPSKASGPRERAGGTSSHEDPFGWAKGSTGPLTRAARPLTESKIAEGTGQQWIDTPRSPGKRRWLAVVLLLACFGYPVVYFLGYRRPPDHPPPTVSPRAARVAAQVLGLSVGGGAVWAWPVAAAVVLAVLTWTTVTLVRRRAIGLIAVLAGVVGLAMAVGVGRAGFDNPDMGLWSRYAVLTWPALLIAYLVGGNRVRAGLCVLMLAALPANTAFGLSWGGGYADIMDALEADVRAGRSPAEVVARSPYLIETGRAAQIADGMRLLKQARFGYFREANVP